MRLAVRALSTSALSTTAKLSLAGLVIVVALIVGLWPRDARAPGGSEGGSIPAADLREAQGRAALRQCPKDDSVPPSGPLAGLRLQCLSDGLDADMGAALPGRPTLVNVWAFWCAPCGVELPLLNQFADRVGDRMNVVTVHSSSSPELALRRLTELGVHLPTFQDSEGSFRAKVGAPAVLPISVLFRADGTIATVVARPFDSVDDVAQVVSDELGVQ